MPQPNLKNLEFTKTWGIVLACLVILSQLLVQAVVPTHQAHAANATIETPLTFTKLGTHPEAAAMPQAYGKQLISLTVFNNKLLAGYGDYGSNIGPIAINPFDLSTNTFKGMQLNFSSESIGTWVAINGKLYTPTIDTKCGGECPSGYAVSSDGGATWQYKTPVNADHIFDMATLTGTDLWMFGSADSQGGAAAWRSTDDGQTWNVVHSGGPGGDARFYWGAALNGKMYMQNYNDHGAGSPLPIQVFDGTNWTTLPVADNLCNTGNRAGGPNPVVYDGKIICYWMDHLKVFNGTTVSRVALPDTHNLLSGFSANDLNISMASQPDAFYMVDYYANGAQFTPNNAPDGILRSPDMVHWERLTGIPTSTTSMAIDSVNHKVYVGTYDAGLYVANLPALPTFPPDTTSPTLTITAPAASANHLISDPLTITADASDDVALSSVQFKLGELDLGTVTASPYSATFNDTYNSVTKQWSVAAGNHVITAIATDSSGNVTQKQVNVTFTLPPVTTMTMPQASLTADSSDLAETLSIQQGNIDSASSVAESSLAVQDPGFDYPTGLTSFQLSVTPGSSQRVTLQYQTNLKFGQVVARKYNSVTKQYSTVPHATISEVVTGGVHYLTLQYMVTDGGLLDQDGLANGIIIDPVGLGVRRSSVKTNADANSNSNSKVNLPNTGENINTVAAIAALAILSGLTGLVIRRYKLSDSRE